VWIIYHLHRSTASDNGSLLKPKIQPPKLGSKVGLFSTRSLHRPNLVGLSVVWLSKVTQKVDLKKRALVRLSKGGLEEPERRCRWGSNKSR
jgi:tRNA (Thr-GGU) A37 N-methylase